MAPATPVSMASTTNRHRWDAITSGELRAFALRAMCSAALVIDHPRVQGEVKQDTKVVSTAIAGPGLASNWILGRGWQAIGFCNWRG